MTVLSFNNLMKVFQDTQEELQKLLHYEQNSDPEEMGKIIIETYDVESQDNDDDCIESNIEKVYNNQVSITSNSEKNHVTENMKQDSCFNNDLTTQIVNLEKSENSMTSTNGSEVTAKKYSCDKCGDVFLLKSGFIHHMWQKHNICIQTEKCEQYSTDVKITLPAECSDKAFKFVQTIPSKPRMKSKFQCQICKQSFGNRVELKAHYNSHRTIKCIHCDAAFIKNSYLKDHMLMHSNDKKFVCDVCGKSFKYRNGLSVHKTVHLAYKSHICDVCGLGFNAKNTLLTHIKLKHSADEKKYACSECDLVFKVKSWLDKHFQRKHTKNRSKDFVCSKCGIAYLNKYTLTRHINNIHMGNGKRYSCHICEKSYTMRNKVITHMQSKHGMVLS